VHVHYGAGERVPVHDHPKTPTLYVYLSDAGPVKFVHTDDDDSILVRRAVRTGQWRLSPGREEIHRVESLSKTASDFLRVEFKTLALHLDSLHARGTEAGEDFWKHPNRVEFEDAHVRVLRVGVLPGEKDVVLSGGARDVVLAVRVRGVVVGGKKAHPGEAWDSAVKASAGESRGEFLRVELK